MVEVFAPLESACGETAACAAAIAKSDKAAAKAATPDSGCLPAKPVSDPIGEYATGVSRFGEQIVIDPQASTRGAVFQDVLGLDAARGCLEQAGLPWILKFTCR